MSKNIVIQEGGVGKQMTIDKLKTNLVSGGTCLWVPEDEVTLGSKHITKDGTYYASADGKYGYEYVTVSGIGRVTGKDPNTGEEIEVTAETDPQTGQPTIVTKTIPSSIDITTEPTRKVYTEGDLLDFSGLVVKAKLKNGTVFTNDTYPQGIIPRIELDFPIKVAPQASKSYQRVVPAGLNIGGYTSPITVYAGGEQWWCPEDGLYLRNYFSCALFPYTTRYGILAVPADAELSYKTKIMATGAETTRIISNFKTTTYNGKTVKWFDWVNNNNVGWHDMEIMQRGSDFFGETERGNLAWTMIYGELQEYESIIPVQWINPYNGKTLEDTFTITINPAPESNGNDSGVDAVTGADPVAGGGN